MSAPHLVLVVEDDPAVAEFLQLALRAMGHEAIIALDGQEALTLASEHSPHFVLLDALLPKIDGFAVLRELRKSLPSVPIVMMSGIYQKRSYVQDAIDLGAREYLLKPLSVLKVWELAERYLGEAAPGARDPQGFAGTPLSQQPLACVLGSLWQERSTGMLFVRGSQGTAILFVEDGRIIFGRSNDAQTRLDRVLQEMGKLSREAQLQAKQLLDKAKGRARLGDLLVEAGLLDPADLRTALDRQQRLHVTRPLTWTEGKSQFFRSETPRQESFKLDLDIEALIVWAARHLAPGPALEAWLPSNTSRVRATRDLALESARFSLSAPELELLKLADGTRTLGALRAMGRLAQVDVDRLAAAFCSLGILETGSDESRTDRSASALASAPAAGAVKTHSPSRVLLGTSFAGKTGALRFEQGASVRTVWFDEGCIAFANSNDPQDRLGQVLLRAEFVTPDQLRSALDTARATPGAAIGRILVDQGVLELDDLHRALVAQVREVVAGLVCWRDGTFNFTSGALPTLEIVPLALDPLLLVLEALRVTPFTELAAALPDGDSHLRKTWQCFELAEEIKLTELEDRLLSTLDAHPRVGGLLDVLGEDPQASLRAVHLLLSLGLIEAQADRAGAPNVAVSSSVLGAPSDDGFADEDFGDEDFTAAPSATHAPVEDDWNDEAFDDESFAAETASTPSAPSRNEVTADPEQSFAGLADEPAFTGLIEAGSRLDPQRDDSFPPSEALDSFAGLADDPALSGLIEAGSALDPQHDPVEDAGPGHDSGETHDFSELAGLVDGFPAESASDLFAGELGGESGFTASIDAGLPLDFGLTEGGPAPRMSGVELGDELAAAFAGLEPSESAASTASSTQTAVMEPVLDPAVQAFFLLLADHLRRHPGAVPDHVRSTLPPELRARFGL